MTFKTNFKRNYRHKWIVESLVFW